MEKETFKNKILDIIKEKDISPKPKWQFVAKDYLVWFLGIISVLIGGVAFSVIIFVLANADWQSYRFLSGSLLEHIIKVAPLYWILFLAIFILVSDYNFKKTKDGYKYSVPKVVGVIVFISFCLGLFFYEIGLAHITDYALGDRLPGFHRFVDIKQKMWNVPDKGLLAGTIVPSEKSDFLILKDFDGNEWKVGVANLNQDHFDVLDNFDTVVFSGSFVEDGYFEACSVKPWEIKGVDSFLAPTPILSPDKFERNDFWLRMNKCGRGTTSPRIQKNYY